MGSGGGSSQSSQQVSDPGTLSPVTATLLQLFGGNITTNRGQFQPTSFGGPGAIFTPQTFAALPGLQANQPLTAVESFLLGAQQVPGGGFQLPSGTGAVAPGPQTQQKGAGQTPEAAMAALTPAQRAAIEAAGGPQTVFGGGVQGQALLAALQGQGLLEQAGTTVSELLEGPEAAVRLARRGFEQETIPAILERAPGFSSSDLQREVTRAGADLDAQIAALREQTRGSAAALAPTIAQAIGSNLLDQTANILGFGQLGREFVRDVSPAGDALRMLTIFQGLTGQAITTQQTGGSRGESKNVGVLS